MTQQHVALVTGAARGIGQAISKTLVEQGMAIIGVDVLEIDDRVFEQTIRGDLADPDFCRRVAAEMGRVDVLVNDAALFIQKPIEEFTVEEFDKTVAVNLRAAFLLSQAAVAGMKMGNWGRIINIASIGARTGGIQHAAVYSATKAGLVSLTKSFARFFGPYGITANAIAPGAVETYMTSHWTDEQRAQFLSEIPLRRVAKPTEIASVVAFLASDAASYITGATIDANGGWVMP